LNLFRLGGSTNSYDTGSGRLPDPEASDRWVHAFRGPATVPATCPNALAALLRT
jgi:alpha/beta superfamily hydrolase